MAVDTLLFLRLLDSDANTVCVPRPSQLVRSAEPGYIITESAYMDQPLSWYWVNSSHNTHVPNRRPARLQLRSCKSAAEQHASRCRYVEINCWDRAAGVPDYNPGDQPVVTHGSTVCAIDRCHMVFTPPPGSFVVDTIRGKYSVTEGS